MVDRNDVKLAEEMRAATGAFVRKTRQGSGTPSDTRAEVLGYLDRSGTPLSAARIAKLRNVTHQSTRALLAEMAAEGLVAGAPDPGDARATLFAITASGTRLLEQSRAARSTWLADNWISKMSSKEREALRVVIRAMDRLVEAG